MPDSPWTIGDVVHDREDDTPDPAIIVNTPDASAEEWDIPRFGTTLAEDNPDYPPDAPVITVVFEEMLADSFPNWTRENRISYATLAERSVQYYSFPAPRLESAEPPEATDPNGETDDETTSPSTTDEDETEPGTTTAGDIDTAPSPSTDESSPDPSAAMRALQQRLNDGGMTTSLEDDSQTIRASKLGETYRLRPGDVLEGEGALRSRLEDIVTDDDLQEAN